MQDILRIVLGGTGGFLLFSGVMIWAIAEAHRPFTLKDFVRDFFKALYEGINPEKRKEK